MYLKIGLKVLKWGPVNKNGHWYRFTPTAKIAYSLLQRYQHFTPGQVFPSAQHLAEEMGAKRLTVQLALEVLEHTGRIGRSAHGRGLCCQVPDFGEREYIMIPDEVLRDGGVPSGCKLMYGCALSLERTSKTGKSEAVGIGVLCDMVGISLRAGKRYRVLMEDRGLWMVGGRGGSELVFTCHFR